MKAVFLRVIEAADKAEALKAVISYPEATLEAKRFDLRLDDLSSVPRSPFAYWISESVLRSFQKIPPFESSERTARRGPSTCDDTRYLRCYWEVMTWKAHGLGDWRPFAKGGIFSQYYADVHLQVEWEQRRSTFLGFFGRPGREIAKPESVDMFFRPGLTWSLRTSRGLSMRAMPSGGIFGHKGPVAFVEGDNPHDLLPLLAVANSAAFASLVELQLAAADAAARSYEVGVIQRTPVPYLNSAISADLATLCHRAWSLKRTQDTRTENSHAFALPALLQLEGESLAQRGQAWANHVAGFEEKLSTIQAEIDDHCFGLYGISDEDREAMIRGFGSVSIDGADDDKDDEAGAVNLEPLVANLVSWIMGVAQGRFDLRLATGEQPAPPEPEPFDPLPPCSPGMLTGEDGLPLDAPPKGYPVDFPPDGILVDDPGHDRDVTAWARQVFGEVFGEDEGAYWHEAAEILEPRTQSIRSWLLGSFFEQHIKKYSKSRRKAPIYWQLATPGASYSVWLYLHRFTRDTLFKVHGEFVTPKVQHEERRLASMRQEAGPSPTASHRKEMAAQEDFVAELRAFQAEVARVAPLWNPDLNDGVIINFAPLWRLVPQHKPWQKECKKVWDKLCKGDYDWAHLAMHLWPERVVPRCQEDRSLAIAHGLEDELWQEDDNGKWHARKVSDARIQELIQERTSPAVKAALDDLLKAPAPAAGKKRRAPRHRQAQPRTTKPKKAPSGAALGSRGRKKPRPVDLATLDAVRDAVRASQDGATKTEVLNATGLTGTQWNMVIKELLVQGCVVKTGKARGTRYHLKEEEA